MTETEQLVCRNIRKRVDKLGLNRQQFALAARLTWPNAAAYYAGTTCPSMPVLDRIAAALGCSVADLVKGE